MCTFVHNATQKGKVRSTHSFKTLEQIVDASETAQGRSWKAILRPLFKVELAVAFQHCSLMLVGSHNA